MITARFKKSRLPGELLKENTKTVWMRLSSGRVVKRHKVKHSVE